MLLHGHVRNRVSSTLHLGRCSRPYFGFDLSTSSQHVGTSHASGFSVDGLAPLRKQQSRLGLAAVDWLATTPRMTPDQGSNLQPRFPHFRNLSLELCRLLLKLDFLF